MRTAPALLQGSLPRLVHLIVAEIEVSKRYALPQHSCKAPCPDRSDLIVAQIEVSQRPALPQHSCQYICPRWSNEI